MFIEEQATYSGELHTVALRVFDPRADYISRLHYRGYVWAEAAIGGQGEPVPCLQKTFTPEMWQGLDSAWHSELDYWAAKGFYPRKLAPTRQPQPA